MNSTTKNTLYVVIAIVVVVIIVAIAGNSGSGTPADQVATTTDTKVTTGANTGASSGGTGSNTSGSNVVTPDATDAAAAMAIKLQDKAFLATLVGKVTMRVPQTGVDVTLVGGEASYTDTNGTTKGRVSVGPVIASIRTTDGFDVFTDMTVTRNGETQVQHYAALFHVVNPETVKFKSAVLVGDRLPITSVIAKADKSVQVMPSQSIMNSEVGYFVEISYLTRKNGEPITATPTLTKSIIVNVKGHIAAK